MNTGDTAWLLIASALVFLMTPGLAFFYGGLVRDTDVINTIKMSFVSMAVIALEWAIVGYSLSFSSGSVFLGGLDWAGLSGVGETPNADYAANVPHLAFMAYQMMFAIITPALISGAIVGRMRFKTYLLFILLWGLLIYNPLAHWVWGVGGWLRNFGTLDFAGGTVVHISAGFSALIAAIILGPRESGKHTSQPHNVPFVILGTSLLWFGWFGFNAGSALGANGLASLAMVTTTLSAAAAVTMWILIEMIHKERPTSIGACIAAVVGLVAITPAAGFVTPMSAILIGLIASAASYGALQLFGKTKIDDTLDVFACHGVGGVVGALLTGIFATKSVNEAGADGLLAGNPSLLVSQVVAILATAIFAMLGTALIMLGLKYTLGLRPRQIDETGIDTFEHGERAYDLSVPAHRQAEGNL
jgi:Amt family ammonium transporter